QALQRGVDVEHAATARAQHVPRQLEQADAGRVQEGGNRLLFVEAAGVAEIEDVDAAELVVWRVVDQPLDGGDAVRVRCLAQNCEQCLRFTHDPRLRSNLAGPPV